MKVYEGLNEKTKDIIVDVLEKYCVPKRIETMRTETFFGDFKTYNIHLDLKDEPLKFVKQKVEERLKLEKSFNLKPVEPNIQPKENQKSALVKEIEESKENKLSNFWNKILNKIFNNESPKEEVKSLEDFVNDKEMIVKDLSHLSGTPLLDLLLAPLEMDGKEVKFDDLDDMEKQELLKRVPLEDLRSKNCKIIKSSMGLSVSIRKLM